MTFDSTTGPSAERRTHWLAITSLLTGIFGFCCPILFIAALVCGFLGISEINKAPARFTGKGMAVVGIVGGLVWGVVWIVVVVLFANSPDARIYTGSETSPADREWLVEHGVIDANETLVYYYDDSMIGRYDDLSIVTATRCLRHVEGTTTAMAFEDVETLHYTPGSIGELAVITMTSSDGEVVSLSYSWPVDPQRVVTYIEQQTGVDALR